MIELPESVVLAQQLKDALYGKRIASAVAGTSPHKFAWYTGDPAGYGALLDGRVVDGTESVAGYVLIRAENATIRFHDGINLRYFAPGVPVPGKHQLALAFDDGSSLIATVSMYGGMDAYEGDPEPNCYYLAALEKPSPFTDAFDEAYFDGLLSGVKPTMSAKAFLATEQRIPGLGNGVLQDILLRAHVHPARKLNTLTDRHVEGMFAFIKSELAAMRDLNGRDTERDIHANPGDYRTMRSSPACPLCGGAIERKAFLGGNVYFCPACQPLK